MAKTSKDVLIEKLAREVLRKLRLAVEVEEKEDRETICAELFEDVTGSLDELAKGQLGALDATLYFEVLAPYFLKAHDAAEALLYVCRRLWGQPHVAPIYAMLLHQWLLLHKHAGGAEQRLKHLKVMVSGMRHMFEGDVEAGKMHMQPMHAFMCAEVVLSPDRRRLDSLPMPSRLAVLSVVAMYLPYYAPQELASALEDFPSPAHTLEEGGHHNGEAADFVIGEVTEALRHISGEAGLLRYLASLQEAPSSPHFKAIRPVTRLMLESSLYQLTAVGGPRYLTRRVNSAAFVALDRLFPRGQWSRRLISWACRFIHPTEWPWVAADAAKGAKGTAESSARLAWGGATAWAGFWLRPWLHLLAYLLPGRGKTPSQQQQQHQPTLNGHAQSKGHLEA
mmetsp:Transcript_1655/g.4818  ORF Transcript_1655/g.4818 Transcript_1655/m.4818 type:complete len:394 (-) Transcript_1655:573-1754(-)